MRITLDLDDVIFNTIPLYELAFKQAGQTFTQYPTNWNLHACYDEKVCDNLYKLFKSDLVYNMSVIDNTIPDILNTLIQRPDIEVLFVTQRLLKQPFKTFKQLRNNSIHCSYKSIYDKEGKKSDILAELKTDLHFDDSPHVISDCIKANIPVVMISNPTTPYNYHLRNHVEHYTDLRTALITKGIYTTTNSK